MKKHESVLGKVRSILGISVLNAISKNAALTRSPTSQLPSVLRLHYGTNFVKLLTQ